MGVKQIRRLVIPIAMPLTEDKQLDEERLRLLVNHDLKAEPKAILVNGTTAESSFLSTETKNKALDIVVEELAGRTAVLAHTTGASVEETITNTTYAQEHGADAALIDPFEFHNSNRGLPQAVHQVASQVDLPIVLYNQPRVRNLLEQLIKGEVRVILPKYFKRILLENANVVGIKDSSGEPELFNEYMRAAAMRKGTIVLQGDESRLATNLGHGAVPSLANVYPQLFRYFFIELIDDHGVLPIQSTINYMSKRIYCGYQKIRGGIKTALSYLGICGKTCAEPNQELTSKEDQTVKEVLEEYELIPKAA